MLHKIPKSLLGNEDQIAQSLTALLPDLAVKEARELLAQQAGHGSFAAMQVWEEGRGVSPADLSVRAASGRVLPLLVHAASLEGEGRRIVAADILRRAETVIDGKSFVDAIADPFKAALRAPEGACRWFYAVATSNILLQPKAGEDRYWGHKACELLSGLLVLAAAAEGAKSLDKEFLESLCKEAVPNSPWEREAIKLVQEAALAPGKTLDGILVTVRSGLAKSVEVPDLGIAPCGAWSASKVA